MSEFVVEIDMVSHEIILKGDLDGSEEMQTQLRNAFSHVTQCEAIKWEIHANEARVSPKGIDVLIRDCLRSV